MKKRIIAAVMALLLTVAFAMPVAAADATPFRDVPATHFAFHAINWVSQPGNGGIMVGDALGYFNPNQNVTKFDAARIFALAAGFRSAAHPVPQALRDEINRSFDQWRPFIDSMAAEHPQWRRVADREIAFLLYRGILTTEDVENFMGTHLTRQEAVVWMVRLIGRGPHAAAVVIPFHNPFADNALIDTAFIRYVYYAREAGIVTAGADNMFHPEANMTRAQLAIMFYTTLGGGADADPLPGTNVPMTPVSGVVELVYRNSQIFISSPLGPQNYLIAEDAMIIVDNVQRSAAFIRTGMSINAVLNAQGQIISLVARTITETPTPTPTPTPPPGPVETPAPVETPPPPPARLYADEGFVMAVTANPATVTIRTQRVRITGQIVDEERTFSLAPNAAITRGGTEVPLSDAQPRDIAFFRFNGSVIYELELEDRVRMLEGVLLERRLYDSMGHQVIIVEVPDGTRYELRLSATTEITRGLFRNLRLQDLRIGDSVIAVLESGVMTALHATGTRTVTEGQLTEIRVRRSFSEITVEDSDGHTMVYTIMPGVFDVYSLRIGMELRLILDSWEIMDIQVIARTGHHTTAVLGNVRAIRANQQLELVELDGAQPRTHTIVIDDNTINAVTGARLNFSDIRVNMNLYVVMVGPQSNIARTVTILP